MRLATIAAAALLSACATTAEFDALSLQNELADDKWLESTWKEPSPPAEGGFVSLFEQRVDGSWVLRQDPALVP